MDQALFYQSDTLHTYLGKVDLRNIYSGFFKGQKSK
jgi:hypothetical protein